MVARDGATDRSRVLGLFAELLDYPRPGLAQKADECRALVARDCADAAALLAEFAAFAERTPHAAIEEIYTGTFELNASCHLYVGYHMFGEAYKRSAFLLELKARFRAHNFESGVELPDHISVLLRFMSLFPDAELTNELVRDALLPTLEPMAGAPDAEPIEEGMEDAPEGFGMGDDYRRVLQALRLILLVRYGVPEEVQPIPLPDPARLVS
jgi:nitrate reductase molybdenum cofactor assembly chaperone NarJ/NarW